ncbi:MAG: UTP--glucose-1-phosphate uridylyltransferase [Myxococcales bacterium]|nr:UTP--glucose-1-phosphate uridylyltransferase [Myxococcales bacterium]
MTHPLEDTRLDFALLSRFGFDEPRFRENQAAIVDGRLTTETHRITGNIEPAEGVIDVEQNKEAAREAGETALKGGEVASVVLNGGMATRFGGVVKGVVEVFDGKSFLALKGEDTRRAHERYGQDVPLVLMNSFATQQKTLAHISEHNNFHLAPQNILDFSQSISIRMNPDGSLFVDDEGQPSYHAPGHGDFFHCIRKSGVLKKLETRGIKYILFSNVDNLGATISPVIIGHHILSQGEMTLEVTQKQRTASGNWDKGGAPARINGRSNQVVEGFRFPHDFPQEKLPDFSTNNMIFSVQALNQDVILDRYLVQKKVANRPALQLETITCEASGTLDLSGKPIFKVSLLRVPREGPEGRFFPVKEPADLSANQNLLKERLLHSWAK